MEVKIIFSVTDLGGNQEFVGSWVGNKQVVAMRPAGGNTWFDGYCPKPENNLVDVKLIDGTIIHKIPVKVEILY